MSCILADVNKTIKHWSFQMNYTQNVKIEQVTDSTKNEFFLFIMILKDLILSIFGLRHLSRRIKRPQF